MKFRDYYILMNYTTGFSDIYISINKEGETEIKEDIFNIGYLEWGSDVIDFFYGDKELTEVIRSLAKMLCDYVTYKPEFAFMGLLIQSEVSAFNYTSLEEIKTRCKALKGAYENKEFAKVSDIIHDWKLTFSDGSYRVVYINNEGTEFIAIKDLEIFGSDLVSVGYLYNKQTKTAKIVNYSKVIDELIEVAFDTTVQNKTVTKDRIIELIINTIGR